MWNYLDPDVKKRIRWLGLALIAYAVVCGVGTVMYSTSPDQQLGALALSGLALAIGFLCLAATWGR